MGVDEFDGQESPFYSMPVGSTYGTVVQQSAKCVTPNVPTKLPPV